VNHEQTLAVISLSVEEQTVILAQLDEVLHSAPFRSSKRYPAMLEYCVRLTLAGKVEKLRERQLGISLFSRPVGYDTSSDPIVRMAASEIRKRLAQFYDHAGDEVRVRISLPSGSYVAEFRFLHLSANADTDGRFGTAAGPGRLIRDSDSSCSGHALAIQENIQEVSSGPSRLLTRIAFSLVPALLLLCGYLIYRQHDVRELPGLWRGTVPDSGGQIVVVVGPLSAGDAAVSQQNNPPLSGDIYRIDHSLSVGDVNSTLEMCSMLARDGADCQLKPAKLVDITNLHNRSAVFVGAYNNPWSLRLTESLPYRFGALTCRCILASKTGNTIAGVDFSHPRSQISTDYATISRFHSDVTDGPAIIIAGIGPMGTEAAAEFASSKDRSEELLALAPKGWKGNNVEAVLATDVVNGIPRHTRILLTAFW
jgi:hypothetical protein